MGEENDWERELVSSFGVLLNAGHCFLKQDFAVLMAEYVGRVKNAKSRIRFQRQKCFLFVLCFSTLPLHFQSHTLHIPRHGQITQKLRRQNLPL